MGMAEFSALSGIIGGAMIGTAAALFLLVTGRIAGISGILGGAITTDAKDLGWRLAFLAGLVLGPLMLRFIAGTEVLITPQTSIPVLVLAGLAVGFGTRLGNGCTSGHGVCGLARGSRRSLAATVTFFLSAMVTVFVARHVIGG
jgi:uncharacterized membrane protein YedE/YeeE